MPNKPWTADGPTVQTPLLVAKNEKVIHNNKAITKEKYK